MKKKYSEESDIFSKNVLQEKVHNNDQNINDHFFTTNPFDLNSLNDLFLSIVNL